MEQYSIFEMMYERFHLGAKKIRILELFGGIGSQHLAMKKLEQDGLIPNGFEAYRLVEFDKDCIKSYNAIHNTNFVPMDITKTHASDLGIVDRDKYNYLLFYSFPCTDISLAGLQGGLAKGSGTRSGLLWEVERILNECGTELPQVLILENVKNLLSDKFKQDWVDWLDYLEKKGYKNYYKVLNSKNIGYPNPIPQNRERVFCVSILSQDGTDYFYSFPKKKKLKLTLQDMLEENVDQKYYLSKAMLKYILNRTPLGEKGNFANNIIGNDFKRVSGTITTKGSGGTSARGEDTLICESMTQEEIDSQIYRKNQIIRVGNYSPSGHNSHSVVSPKDIAPTVMENHGQVTAIIEEPKVIGGIGEKKSNGGKQWYQQDRIYDGKKVAISVTTTCNPYYSLEDILEKKPIIRKLTSRECWRLMAFPDDAYDRASQVVSETQLYKQAGNSIVVNVLCAIFKELL